MNACTMPGCQTTAGCICDRVSRRPLYHFGTPERQLVYAWAGEVNELRTENRRLRAALAPFAKMADEVDEWTKGTGAFAGQFKAYDLRAARAALGEKGSG